MGPMPAGGHRVFPGCNPDIAGAGLGGDWGWSLRSRADLPCNHRQVTKQSSVSSERRWQFPRLSDNRMVGGAAAGIAEELGLDPLVVRAAFIILAAAGGWGFVLYGISWVLMSRVDKSGRTASVPKAASDNHRLLGFGLVLFGMLLLSRGLGGAFVDSLVWPVTLFVSGVAVAHQRGVTFGLGRTDDVDESDRSAFLVRVAGGSVLVLAGVILAVSLNFDLGNARDAFLVVGIVVAGLGLVMGPYVSGLVNDLTAERRARVRSDERAEVAAHLHDSVLQTLLLIQRRADDPQVVSMARKQERELRGWLNGRGPSGDPTSFRDTLEADLAEIEELHAIPVEVVVVGDCTVDANLVGVLAAVREAVNNAAVHAGADAVDVFAEVSEQAVDVFVRDTGVGFDPDQVPVDRRGVADSIVGRMERLGGTAVLSTAPGVGTEVELHLDRRQQ